MKATNINIADVQESSTNPRKRFGDLGELASSIKALGVLQPILVRPVNGSGVYECVFGHRRLRAAKLADLERIPAQIRELSDAEVLEAQLVENVQRADIHPIEEADAYRAALAGGALTVDDIAAKVGKSKSHVYARLRLADLGERARGAFLDELLSAGVAMLLTRLDEKRQSQALDQLLKRGGATAVRDAVYVLRDYTHDLRNAPFSTKDAELVPEAGPCGTCPKRSGNQTDLFGNVDGEHPETCTDPACYAHKVDTTWQQAKARAEARGLKVLSSKEAFEGYGYLKRELVEAKNTPAEAWKLPKSKTWKQLVGKELKPILTQNPRTGEVVEVFDAKEARKALPSELREKKSSSSKTTSSPKTPSGVDEAKVENLVEMRVLQLTAELAQTMSDIELLRTVAADALELGEVDGAKLGWDFGKGADAIRAAMAKAKPAQVRAVILADLVTRESPWSRWSSVHPISNALGIDVKATRKSVTDELVLEVKAAKTKTKGETPKASKKAR